MKDYQQIIDTYYKSGQWQRHVLISHSRQVTALALEIAHRNHLQLSDQEIETAAMLHDIGICRCYAPDLGCTGDAPYICHGILGGAILAREDMPEWLQRVAMRHTGAGLTKEDIISQNLPLPPMDLLPETTLEKLICYADKFYSKSGDMQRKPLETVINQMRRFGDDSLARFMELHNLFAEDVKNT